MRKEFNFSGKIRKVVVHLPSNYKQQSTYPVIDLPWKQVSSPRLPYLPHFFLKGHLKKDREPEYFTGGKT
jgi:hypothetical protein